MMEQKNGSSCFISIYDSCSVHKLFEGLKLATSSTEKQACNDVEKKSSDDVDLTTETDTTDLQNFVCNSCSLQFDSSEEQREHFHCDWHLYNARRTLKGLEAVDEGSFEDIIDRSDLSSLSGSASSDDEKSPTQSSELMVQSRQPRIYLTNAAGQLLSVYKVILQEIPTSEFVEDDIVHQVKTVSTNKIWAILLNNAGHFAAAVFDGETVLAHKTFHRYVVRAKRGTAQSARDSSGKKPKSAGAQIRRYNERALREEIQQLLQSWSEHLLNCSRIFIRCSVYNRSAFFAPLSRGKPSPLRSDDPRVRSVPFATQRSTYKELLRVRSLLSSVHVHGLASEVDWPVPSERSFSPRKHKCKEAGSTVDEELGAGTPDSEWVVRAAQLRQQSPTRQGDESSSDDDVLAEMTSEMFIRDTKDLLSPFDSSPRRGRSKKSTEPTAHDQSTGLPIITDVDPEPVITTKKKRRRKPKKAEQTEEVEPVAPDKQEPQLSAIEQEVHNRLFTAVTTGNLSKVETELSAASENRDQPELSRRLVNTCFGADKQTMLHTAILSGLESKDVESSSAILTCLMLAGADPSVKDMNGKTPYMLASSRALRNEFRRFRAQHEHMYDYRTSGIPDEPLDEQAQLERKQREANKRRAAKKAKKLKNQEQLAEKCAREAEEAEQRRYLSLSDREKRALAAERRLLQQTDTDKPLVLSRCFQCAHDITGKVPFEYKEFRFCSPRCLKLHRASQSKSS